MRRPEIGSIGRRLAHVRAHLTQKEQAKRLGVAERTYQNYEQDIRSPDTRTLLGLFIDGWDLNWVLCGVGTQRLDPRILVQYMLEEAGFVDKNKPIQDIARDVQEAYNSREFPVPSWVYDELESLSDQDANAVVSGDWMVQSLHSPRPIPTSEEKACDQPINPINSINYGDSDAELTKRTSRPIPDSITGRQSHPLKPASLKLAVQLTEEALEGGKLGPADYGQLVALIYDALVNGLPSAQVLAFARPAARGFSRGNGDAAKGMDGPGKGAAGKG